MLTALQTALDYAELNQESIAWFGLPKLEWRGPARSRA